MQYVKCAQILEIRKEAVSLFPGSRDSLFASIVSHKPYIAANGQAPSDIFLSDLNYLNESSEIHEDKPLFWFWLDSARHKLDGENSKAENVKFFKEFARDVLREYEKRLVPPGATDNQMRHSSVSDRVYLAEKSTRREKTMTKLLTPEAYPIYAYCGCEESVIDKFVSVTFAGSDLKMAADTTAIFDHTYDISAQTLMFINLTISETTNREDYHGQLMKTFQGCGTSEGVFRGRSQTHIAAAFRENQTTRIVYTKIDVKSNRDQRKALKLWSQYWSEFQFSESNSTNRHNKLVRTVIPILDIPRGKTGRGVLSNLLITGNKAKILNKPFKQISSHSGDIFYSDDLPVVRHDHIKDWLIDNEIEMLASLPVDQLEEFKTKLKKVFFENSERQKPKPVTLGKWAKYASELLTSYLTNNAQTGS